MRVVSSNLVENSGRNWGFGEDRSVWGNLRASVFLFRFWGTNSPGRIDRFEPNFIRTWITKLSFEWRWSQTIWLRIGREIVNQVMAGLDGDSHACVTIQRARAHFAMYRT
jgi:hypothetical protein